MTDDGSMSTKNLAEFLPPRSEIRGGVYAPSRGKISKIAITQPRIARLHWNLAGWKIGGSGGLKWRCIANCTHLQLLLLLLLLLSLLSSSF